MSAPPLPLILTAVLCACTAPLMAQSGYLSPGGLWVPVPPENPVTSEKAVLGKILFWEEQLSADSSVACGTCHRPAAGGGDPRSQSLSDPTIYHPGYDGVFGTDDDGIGSKGVVRCDPDGYFTDDGTFFPGTQVTRRKAPSFIGAVWSDEQFWDGRASQTFRDPVTNQVLIPSGGGLESQALAPLTSPEEMACEMRPQSEIVTRLQGSDPLKLATNLPPDVQSALNANPTYADLFQAAFGSPGITLARVAMAIATYERTLIPDQTPFDVWQNGNGSALTAGQIAGLTLFETTASCNVCHQPPEFTDGDFHNVGVRPPIEDEGRKEVTGLYQDRGKFKTPTLRNVGIRAPFFHNGAKATLSEVLLFYNGGGDFSENLDPVIQPLNLSHTERVQIIDFIANALLDPRVQQGLPPFDRPTLRSEQPPNPVTFGTGVAGTRGHTPTLVAPSPPYLGSELFHFGMARGLGGAQAVAGFNLVPAFGQNIWSVPVYVALSPQPVLISRTLSGPQGLGGAGYDSFRFPIPDDPALANVTVFAQWVVFDPGTATGLSSTSALQFTFQDL